VRTGYEAGFGNIMVTTLDSEGASATELEGTLSTPEGKEIPLIIEATAPGQYEGQFLPEGEGVYLIQVALPDGGTLATVGYSPEFDYFGQKEVTAEAIARMGDGRVITMAKEVYTKEAPPVEGVKDLSRLLLLLGLIVFVAEIVLRKVTIHPKTILEKIKDKANIIPENGKQMSSTATEHIDALMQQKKDRHGH